ncbi:glycoside hydrolase family 16 protein [Pedobacter polaris]|uniref:Glycoside hydrolase family 16 protein n=1 Tax=Pedobacter polaris TaxID=2571273 RepID=A0A4U1CR95_9SPHI|nr:glycoside hydrolase family 16 protein [Pedobacter polaris]TKC09986.1 glycoside hydrolase family 16 protein [Pedobacter polaris]
MKFITKRRGFFLIALSAGSILSCQSCSSGKGVEEPIIIPPTPTVVVDKNWTFEATPNWSDEFDYTGLPLDTKWDYDLGGSGWGNNEKQLYTNSPSNVNVGGGLLTITAKKENLNGMAYTSTRLVTRNKMDVTYGRIEVKAKLPTGKGTWPAIWMLPTDRSYGDWPKSGEIDIMEHVGYDQNKVHFSTHTEAYYFKINTAKTSSKLIADASTAFHLYRVDWTPYAVRGYFDNVLVFEFANEGTGYKVWPFDKRFHVLLNLAIGGDWGGAQGIDDSIFPQKFEIDYVRYYKMIEK